MDEMLQDTSPRARALTGAASLLASVLVLAGPAHAADRFAFDMVRSSGLPNNCASHAWARVNVKTLGFAEQMTVTVAGLPVGTELDLFTIQQPNSPFAVGWYVGDLEIGRNGSVTKTFVGRFNIETFALGSGQAATPVTHPGRDANRNPAFEPVHTYHLGI